ncbi:MAG: YiiX family permuted papain-like enzyme [Bacteroidetes bacterium]|nr:YiiX family permuted papain-like enzyme [Bacteroidota bacterium]
MKRISLITAFLLFVSALFFNFNFKQEKGIKKTASYAWLKDGDILFQDTGGDLGEAIKIATKSKYSHCGMVIKEGNSVQVFEAIGPVQYTPINEWVKHGANNSFKAYRLKNPGAISQLQIKAWKVKAIDYLGKSYDHVFGWSDDKIYCSELVWKMYKNIGLEISTPKKLRDFDLSHKLVKQQLQMRYGTAIPYEEKVVSPQDLLDSKFFIEVVN